MAAVLRTAGYQESLFHVGEPSTSIIYLCFRGETLSITLDGHELRRARAILLHHGIEWNTNNLVDTISNKIWMAFVIHDWCNPLIKE